MNQDVITYATAGLMPLAILTGTFNCLVTIKQPPPNSLSATGGQAPLSDYTAVPGLSAIACVDEPEHTTGVSANETMSVGQVQSRATRIELLDNYYPLLSPETNWGDVGWIAEVDSTQVGGAVVTYRLLGADCDPQRTQTRLRLERVTV